MPTHGRHWTRPWNKCYCITFTSVHKICDEQEGPNYLISCFLQCWKQFYGQISPLFILIWKFLLWAAVLSTHFLGPYECCFTTVSCRLALEPSHSKDVCGLVLWSLKKSQPFLPYVGNQWSVAPWLKLLFFHGKFLTSFLLGNVLDRFYF